MTAGGNSISVDRLQLHQSQQSCHHLTVCSFNDGQEEREKERERGRVMTVSARLEKVVDVEG